MKYRFSTGLASTIALAIFALLAIGSAKVNKIHCGAFSYIPYGEERGHDNYVLLNDGRKVYGEKISWKTGLLVKDQIKVGDEKFPIRDTRGYYANGNYFGRIGKVDYAKRIVHGKLNVYYTEDMQTTTSTNSQTGMMRTTTRMVCVHYVQVGENGELEAIANQSDIKKYVSDCPEAVAMIDKKNSQIRKAIRKDRNYLNTIFIVYNNGCKQP